MYHSFLRAWRSRIGTLTSRARNAHAREFCAYTQYFSLKKHLYTLLVRAQVRALLWCMQMNIHEPKKWNFNYLITFLAQKNSFSSCIVLNVVLRIWYVTIVVKWYRKSQRIFSRKLLFSVLQRGQISIFRNHCLMTLMEVRPSNTSCNAIHNGDMYPNF